MTRISRRLTRLVVSWLGTLAVTGCGASAAADTSRPPVAGSPSASAGLTAAQQSAYDAALTAYTGYMRVRVQIAAKPNPDTATAQLAPYVADPLKVNLTSYVRTLKYYNEAVHGAPTFTVVGKDVHADATPMTVDLHVCVNPDGWYAVDLRTGKPIESQHQPKYLTVAHIEDYGSPYGWLVVSVTSGGGTSC